MISAVFDANLLASGAIAPAGGTLASIMDAWQDRRVIVVLSVPILDELERTLHNYLVTGDKQLQKLGSYLHVTLASPAQFLDVLVNPLDHEPRERG